VVVSFDWLVDFWLSSGIARKLKEYNPNIIIVGIDPEGSLLAQPEKLNEKHKLEPYHVEGIGYDFIPHVLDRSLIDVWIKTNDCESLVMMRKLIRDEGLLCGGSSGAAVSGAIVAAQQVGLQAGQRVVVILPDSVRNYMTKALSDDWMLDHGFVDGTVIKAKLMYTTAWWATKRVCDLPLNTPLTITSDVLCKDAIALLKDEGYDMVPVLKDGAVIGVVTEGNMTSRLLAGRAQPDDSVATAGVIYKTFHKFTIQDTLATLAHALDHDPYALIVTEQRCFSSKRRKIVSSSSLKNTADFGGSSNTAIMMTNTGGSINAMIGGSDDNTSVATVDTDTVMMVGSSSSRKSTTARNVATRCVVSGIVTRIDLLDFVSRGEH
jgi:cystathionine beta-synthase